MKLFDKIKALFSKDPVEVKELEKDYRPSSGHECYWCEEDIKLEDKRKSFNKHKFHIQCYRQMIKEVKNDMGAK